MRRRAQVPARALVLLVLAAGCGDDDAAGTFFDAPVDTIPDAIQRFDAPVGEPAGGWQSGPMLYACFGSAGSADFGDTVDEATTSPCCYWDRSGLLYYPNGVTGTWTLEATGGRLVVTVDPPCGDSCGPLYYERIDIACQF